MKKSLLRRILVFIFFCMTVPLLLLSGINYVLTYRQLRENLTRQVQSETDKIAYYMLIELGQYFDASYNMAHNPALLEVIGRYFSGTASIEELHVNLLSCSASSISERVHYPFEYYLLADNAIVSKYSYSGNIDFSYAIQRISDDKWCDALLTGTTEQTRCIIAQDYFNINGGDKIYIARSIPVGRAENAVLILSLDRYVLERLVDNFRPTPDSSIFIFAGQTLIASGEENPYSLEQLSELSLDLSAVSSGEGPVWMDNAQNLIRHKTFEFKDIPSQIWSVVVVAPTKTTFQRIEYIKTATFLLALLCVTATVALFFLAKRYIFDRIVQLNYALGQVGKGNTAVRLQSGQDEIGVLYEEFNRMTQALSESEARAKREEENRISLELKMLQSQITPHFVRNTLNVIRWMAEMLRADSIARAILSLTKLLDYNIREISNGVTLADELQNLDEYIYIQKLRYGNNFTYQVDVDPELLSQNTLKLLMQPLVENCIVHGFRDISKVGEIRISGQREGGAMVITIEDNGVGMTEEKASALLSDIPGAEDDSHIGVHNVHRRIVSRYGPGYGLTIESTCKKGTAIRMRLPFAEGKQ